MFADKNGYPLQSTGKNPRCFVCRSGYRGGQANGDGRPAFQCTSCGEEWTNGYDGGQYLLPGQKVRNA